jgi:hypothetical protein
MISAASVFHTWYPESLLQSIQPIFTEDLVFDLDVKHVFHGVEFFQIQTPPGGRIGMERSNHSMFPSE